MNMDKVYELFDEAGIETINDNGEYKDFEDVLSQLATRWRVLSDDFKNELFDAMGLIPLKKELILTFSKLPNGVNPLNVNFPLDISCINEKN